MFKLLEYYGHWQGFRGRVTQLPAWARLLLMLAALPGMVLIGLSILAFLVSLLALLLLTVPLFRFLTALCGIKLGVVMSAGASAFGPAPEGMDAVVEQAGGATVVETPMESDRRTTRRQIDVRIVE